MSKTTLQLVQQRSAHSELVKVRCTPELKVRLARKALSQESDLSTIARDAFRFYLAKDEQHPLVAR